MLPPFFAHLCHAMTILTRPLRDKKTTLPDVEEELMMEALCLHKNEEEGGLTPLSTSPLILKL